MDMEGKAAAAVEDCMQTFKTYFDFKQLAQIQVRFRDGRTVLAWTYQDSICDRTQEAALRPPCSGK